MPAKFDEQSTFLHSTLLNKIVLEWTIYPIETINDDDDVWISPQKICKVLQNHKKSAISQKLLNFAQYTPQ